MNTWCFSYIIFIGISVLITCTQAEHNCVSFETHLNSRFTVYFFLSLLTSFLKYYETYIDQRNSLAIITVLFDKLKMSHLCVKGSFTHFSVTPVDELFCSPTYNHYVNSILAVKWFVNDSSNKSMKLVYINRQPARRYHYFKSNACGVSAASK